VGDDAGSYTPTADATEVTLVEGYCLPTLAQAVTVNQINRRRARRPVNSF
jgi:hypothetical protein